MDIEKLPHAEIVMAYLDGEASPEERDLAERLLAEDENYQQLAAELQGLHESFGELSRQRLDSGFTAETLQVAQEAAAAARAFQTVPVTEEASDGLGNLPLSTEPQLGAAGFYAPARRLFVWASLAAAILLSVSVMLTQSDRGFSTAEAPNADFAAGTLESAQESPPAETQPRETSLEIDEIQQDEKATELPEEAERLKPTSPGMVESADGARELPGAPSSKQSKGGASPVPASEKALKRNVRRQDATTDHLAIERKKRDEARKELQSQQEPQNGAAPDPNADRHIPEDKLAPLAAGVMTDGVKSEKAFESQEAWVEPQNNAAAEAQQPPYHSFNQAPKNMNRRKIVAAGSPPAANYRQTSRDTSVVVIELEMSPQVANSGAFAELLARNQIRLETQHTDRQLAANLDSAKLAEPRLAFGGFAGRQNPRGDGQGGGGGRGAFSEKPAREMLDAKALADSEPVADGVYLEALPLQISQLIEEVKQRPEFGFQQQMEVDQVQLAQVEEQRVDAIQLRKTAQEQESAKTKSPLVVRRLMPKRELDEQAREKKELAGDPQTSPAESYTDEEISTPTSNVAQQVQVAHPLATFLRQQQLAPKQDSELRRNLKSPSEGASLAAPAKAQNRPDAAAESDVDDLATQSPIEEQPQRVLFVIRIVSPESNDN